MGQRLIYHRSFVRASIIANYKQTEFYVEEKEEQEIKTGAWLAAG